MQQIVADAAQHGPQWLQKVQAPARTSVQASSLPTRKVESWKYTSLRALREDYQPVDFYVGRQRRCCGGTKFANTEELPERRKACFSLQIPSSENQHAARV